MVLTRQDWRVGDELADLGELAGWMGTTQGWWEVEVESQATFDVDVRLEPFVWERPDIHATVHLRVGDDEHVQPWVLQCTRYTFQAVDAPAGPTRIDAWTDGGPGGRRAALYVDLRLAGSEL